MFNFGLKEDGGDWSSTRVNALISLSLTCFYVIYLLIKGQVEKIDIAVLGALLGYAGATKILQKREEIKAVIAEQPKQEEKKVENV